MKQRSTSLCHFFAMTLFSRSGRAWLPAAVRRVVAVPRGGSMYHHQATAKPDTLEGIAAQLGTDELMNRSKRTFGGISYFDTNIDSRFRVIFVLGGPGSGKGTQSEFMVRDYPVVHFSVGELLRNVDPSSPQKSIIDDCLVNGQIVPVGVSLNLLKTAMETSTQRKHALFLVDGFPRNFDNLQGWANFMGDTAVLASVFCYTCPLKVLEQRILSRGQGRADDNLPALQKRFRTFEEETMPVVTALSTVKSEKWSVKEINGDREIAAVWDTTQDALKQLMMDDVVSANQRLLTAAAARDVNAYMSLCDPAMMTQDDFDRTEGTADNDTVQNARVDIITGRQVAVSYDRSMKGIRLREKRIWSHQGAFGWRNVHYQRTPLA